MRIGCNICDSSNVVWVDREGDNHFCKKCFDEEN